MYYELTPAYLKKILKYFWHDRILFSNALTFKSSHLATGCDTTKNHFRILVILENRAIWIYHSTLFGISSSRLIFESARRFQSYLLQMKVLAVQNKENNFCWNLLADSGVVKFWAKFEKWAFFTIYYQKCIAIIRD